MNKRDRRALLTYIGFVAPGLLIYLVIMAYPVIWSVFLSLSNYNPIQKGSEMKLIGLLQYKKMFSNPDFLHAVKNNMIVVAISAFGQIPIGFSLAYILYRKLVKGGKFFQAMVFFPNFLSMIVVGTLFQKMFVADGPIARIIQFVSGNPDAQFELMLDKSTVMIPIGMVLIWMYTGFFMIIFLANLQKINVSMIEAAKIDGASEPQIFIRIIVPLLSGAILVATILAIAGSLNGFALIYSMTQKGVTRYNALVLPVFMYETAFNEVSNPTRFAYGAAIANTIVLISVSLILVSRFIHKKLDVSEEG